MGWAERIVMKPPVAEAPKTDHPIISFTTGQQYPQVEDAKKGMFCERCGKAVQPGVMCASCGDHLPFHADSDPFLSASFQGLFRMIFGPRGFAINFPYPVSGGIIQPILYPAVLASIFVITLPLIYFRTLLSPGDHGNIILMAVFGFILCILLVPLLVYSSAGLIHVIATILGGKCQFRRTVRVFAAGILWILIIGLINNLARWGFFYLRPLVSDFFDYYSYPASQLFPDIPWLRLLTLSFISIVGWLFTWAFGGLYRLRWWNAIILTIAAYIPFILTSWAYLLLYLPLRASGLL
jgi:hypothetical protein